MPSLRLFRCLTLILVLAGCEKVQESFPKTTFDRSFPKRNIDLTQVWGKNLLLKTSWDTLDLKIASFKNYNLIIDRKTRDTLFHGKVCRFRGLYYFNQQLSDTSYWIYAVKVNDNLIYGLDQGWEQTEMIDSRIEKGLHPKLVKHHSAEAIRLHPEKREMKKMFAGIISSMLPDTIIGLKKSAPTKATAESEIAQFDPEAFEFISRVYPNPTAGMVHINLQEKQTIRYQLADLNGRTIRQGNFNAVSNEIDLQPQRPGIYFLTLLNPSGDQNETVKIVKVN